MWFIKSLIFILFTALVSGMSYAQQPTTKKDTTKIYKNIENLSGRNKFTRVLHRMVFKTTDARLKKQEAKRKAYRKLIRKPYSAFEGKTIRFINIESLDPFGSSIADTIVSSENIFARIGNQMHIKTQSSTIRNLLLFRQNHPFDSILVKESERLIRSSSYVTDVSFYVRSVKRTSDSVDIFIREIDKWSIIPKITSTNTRVTFYLTDRNFLGLGHESRNGFTWHHNTGVFAYNTNYHIPNIRNSYINATFHYGTDEFKNFSKSITVDRPFYTPLAKWAAGVNLSQQYHNIYINNVDSLVLIRQLQFNVQDYWAGNAIKLFRGNNENQRTTRFIPAIRYLRIRFPEVPEELTDSLLLYSSEDFLLAGIGISRRKYVQDKYIFQYGITEDVPIGTVYNLTGGIQHKFETRRLYLGARVSSGDYFKWGYFSYNCEYGTFIHNSRTQQGVFTISAIYFSRLTDVGKWKFRQFIKPQLIIGINRLASDSLSLNEGYGLDGFMSPSLSGTSRMLFTFQLQSYSPWNLIGFHFGPYFICSIGMLGKAPHGFSNSRIYSQIGLGVLIKNVNLVINTFQISIVFYPSIPGKGQNIFKFNSVETIDFKIRDFETGKPSIVLFQ